MAIKRDALKIQVAGRVSWEELLNTLEASVDHVQATPEMARDAQRLAAIAQRLKQRAITATATD